MGSKLFRIGLGMGLAVFMGVATVFGGMTVLPVVFTAKAETQQSGLGLDPENDPVVFTTANGIEVKLGMARLEVNESLAGGALSGYPYITMGSYNGYAMNWVIIGKSTDMSGVMGGTIELDSSPAGKAITSDTRFDLEEFVGGVESESWSVVESDEINANCVLVISEYVLFDTQYMTSSGAAKYEGSNLKTQMANLYQSGLNLSSQEKNCFVAQTLHYGYATSRGSSTYYSGTVSDDQYLFPMAWASSDNIASRKEFLCGNYLITDALRVAYKIGTTTASRYWLRDGHNYDYSNGTCMHTSGSLSQAHSYCTNSQGVRPAGVVSFVK